MTAAQAAFLSAVVSVGLAALPLYLQNREIRELKKKQAASSGGSKSGTAGKFSPADASGDEGRTADRTAGSARPFEKGQGMAWLSRMMQTDWRNWLTGNGANTAVYYTILQTFLNMDAEAAAEAALAALEVEKKWNSHDAETRALFKSNDSYQLFMQMAVMRLSQLDPKRALKIVEAGLPKNGELLATVIASAVLNPSVDIESMLGGPEDGNYERKLNAAIFGLALDQPQRARALLEKHPEIDMERQRALLIDTQGSSKPEEAVTLAAAMMEKADRSDALHRALGLWAEADKSRALE